MLHRDSGKPASNGDEGDAREYDAARERISVKDGNGIGFVLRFLIALAPVVPICRVKESVTANIKFAYRQLPESVMVKGGSHSSTTLAKPALNVPASSLHALQD